MNKKTFEAINWNSPTNKFYDELFMKQAEQFWLAEEIPVSDDKSVWEELEPKYKDTYKNILAGLTLLDTEQTTGINKVGEKSNNLFIKSIFALFSGMEAIHARSYSTIFQTLCTVREIDELFKWVEDTKELQSKVGLVVNAYNSIDDDESLYMAYVGSLALEGIAFYGNFFLPLWLAAQGKMVNSGEIVNLILRDEQVHTVACGTFAQELFTKFDESQKAIMKAKAYQMLSDFYDLEVEYSTMLYKDLPELLDEVIVYIQYNVNYALECLGLEPMFEVKESDVNPAVLNGRSSETKQHDFFSTKGNGYVKATNVEAIDDSCFF